MVVSISRDSTFYFSLVSTCLKEELITCKPMDFTPESEDEVIMEVVSHKLDIPIFNPSNKVWRDSNKTKIQLHPSILATL